MVGFSSCFKTMSLLKPTERQSRELTEGQCLKLTEGQSLKVTEGQPQKVTEGQPWELTEGQSQPTQSSLCSASKEPAQSQEQGKRRGLVKACLLSSHASPASSSSSPAAAPGKIPVQQHWCLQQDKPSPGARFHGHNQEYSSDTAVPHGSPAVFLGSPVPGSTRISCHLPGLTWERGRTWIHLDSPLPREALPRAIPCGFSRPWRLGHDRFSSFR